jgi:hypothetical protein
MLSAVEGKERLRVFRADMAEEGSFDAALSGCAALIHVAASMDLHLSPDQHDDGKPRARSVDFLELSCRCKRSPIKLNAQITLLTPTELNLDLVLWLDTIDQG